jgi:hypothetical protein
MMPLRFLLEGSLPRAMSARNYLVPKPAVWPLGGLA